MFSSRKIILIIILLVTMCITAYVIVVVIPTRLAEKSYEGARLIGADIAKIFSFTPEVTVKNTVVLQQQTPVLELATISQQFQHKYEWTNTWLGSTKKITITGGFQTKAGYDLKKRFSIQIDDDKAIIRLPNPQLLSIQAMDNVTFMDEHGVWNWVNMDDRAKAMNAFNADARQYAQQAKFVAQAKESMEKQLREIMKLHGKEVEIRYVDEVRIEKL
ncbi:MAG TPA: DUF4230 domain-containing protein [Chryseolinea sp.]|nr:DUF4230 domain-containing protein [Chryseolinea sp.]